jgi:hypothetical protein
MKNVSRMELPSYAKKETCGAGEAKKLSSPAPLEVTVGNG